MVSSFVLAIAAACASAGCGVQPPKQTTFTFSYDVISERPATTPIDAPSIVDLETPKVALAIIDDKGFRSGGVTMRTTPTTEHGAQFMVSEDDRRVEFVRRNDDGSIALTALITHNAAIKDMAHRVLLFGDGRITGTQVNAARKQPSEISW